MAGETDEIGASGVSGAAPAGKRSGALAVAAGILSSRLVGILRERALAHYLGVGPHADVFRAALKSPNALQNLLGEGTLSASFIPVYSRLLAEGRREEAGRFAGAAFSLLVAAAAFLSLVGVLAAPLLVAVLTMGFLTDRGAEVDRYALTVTAVRILFPMTGVLVLSAWALGVLNSHRRFFLPYFAPVVWNSAIVAALAVAGHLLIAGGAGGAGDAGGRGGVSTVTLDRLLLAACLGALLGALLQFLVQLPLVIKLIQGFRLTASPLAVPGVRQSLSALGPVVAGRGAVQLSGYLDNFLASYLATGALAVLGNAQTLYMLPVSLFAMSVAASQLPGLASLTRGGEAAADPAVLGELRGRVRRALSQIAFLNVPTTVGYLVFGLLFVLALFRTGKFTTADGWLVYWVLAGYTLGLLAATASRLLQNTFYAVGETRAPARIAGLRIALSAVLSVPLMFWLDRFTVSSFVGVAAGKDPHLGALGLALASSLGSWWELAALARALHRRVDGPVLPLRAVGRMLLLAFVAVLPAAGVWWLLPAVHPIVAASAVGGTFAAVYLVAAVALRLPELEVVSSRLRRLRRVGKPDN